MLAYSDERLEECHDYIQWVFPTAEASRFALVFPVLTDADVVALQASPEARTRMLAALNRFRAFFGLGKGGVSGTDFNEDRWYWCDSGDHNLLRITRIIRSLRLFGEEDAATQFAADAMAVAHECHLSSEAIKFWGRALTEPPMKSLR